MSALASLKRHELAAKYNEAAAVLKLKPIKSFKDHATAVARTTEILAQLPRPQVGKPRGFDFNFPPLFESPKVPTRDSHRKQVLALCLKGTTYNEVECYVAEHMKDNGATLRYRTMRIIHDMHYHYGYGIKHERGNDPDNGRITLYTGKE